MKSKNTTYAQPIAGVYTYSVMSLGGKVSYHDTRVDVLGESEKSYRIRLLTPIRDHFVGDEIWVRRSAIRSVYSLDNVISTAQSHQFPLPTNKTPLDLTMAWWNER